MDEPKTKIIRKDYHRKVIDLKKKIASTELQGCSEYDMQPWASFPRFWLTVKSIVHRKELEVSQDHVKIVQPPMGQSFEERDMQQEVPESISHIDPSHPKKPSKSDLIIFISGIAGTVVFFTVFIGCLFHHKKIFNWFGNLRQRINKAKNQICPYPETQLVDAQVDPGHL